MLRFLKYIIGKGILALMHSDQVQRRYLSFQHADQNVKLDQVGLIPVSNSNCLNCAISTSLMVLDDSM